MKIEKIELNDIHDEIVSVDSKDGFDIKILNDVNGLKEGFDVIDFSHEDKNLYIIYFTLIIMV